MSSIGLGFILFFYDVSKHLLLGQYSFTNRSGCTSCYPAWSIQLQLTSGHPTWVTTCVDPNVIEALETKILRKGKL